jgi:hypothetical protein
MFCFRTLIAFLLFQGSLSFADPFVAGNVLPPIIHKTRVLGRELSVRSSARVVPEGRGIETSLESRFLGQKSPLLSLAVESGQTGLYVRGIRVWSGSVPVGEGMVYRGSIAPTRIDFPILSYPLGPIYLQLTGGLEFSGNLEASLQPMDPVTDPASALRAGAQATLASSAFVEGAGRAVLVRGGLNGQVTLVDGRVGAQAEIPTSGESPRIGYLGKANLLSGEVAGHVDARSFFGGWNRVFSRTFFRWPGKCISFGAESCQTP